MQRSGFWTIHIDKDYLKFSAAHMTIFADGHKERLHGHNYEVHVEARVQAVTMSEMIDFAVFKETLVPLCRNWDEKILLPTKNPRLHIRLANETDCEVEVLGKRYVFPQDEVEAIAIENVTVEQLAQHLCERFSNRLQECLKKQNRAHLVQRIALRVNESRGQGATYTLDWN